MAKGLTKVRVLTDAHGFKANDVALLSADAAAAAVAGGWADDAKSAVEYCEAELGAVARAPDVDLPAAPEGEAGEGGAA